MKKCLIVKNGYYDNEAMASQRKELADCFTSHGISVTELKSNEVLCFIEGDGVKTKLSDYDFCVYLDKDVNTALMLEKAGVKVFNSAEAIRLCDDKMLTYIALSGAGVNMIKTISSPIMYYESNDSAFLDTVEKEIGYPVVIKNVYGSMGRNVFLASSREELDAYYQKFKMIPHLYQKYVGKGRGEDLRVITVGGKVVASMRRINDNDFRSNIEIGGRGEKVILTENQIRMAETVSKVLGLDYAGVDIIPFDGDYICEVNSNAFFRGIEAVTGVNVASIYAEHIIKKVY